MNIKCSRSAIGDCENCKYGPYNGICRTPCHTDCPCYKETLNEFNNCICLQVTDKDYCEYFEPMEAEE